MSVDASASYKARKEAFVSNLSGSSLSEINSVTLVAGAAILLWTALQRARSLFTPYTPVAGGIDFLLNVCGILFAITLYSSVPVLLSISLSTPALLLLGLSGAPAARSNGSTPSPDRTKIAVPRADASSTTDTTAAALPMRPFLTHYRGSMLVVTCLAILAVDFPLFPRRFAKAETWGTSLMDLGVGSFVFSAGVVSARSLAKASIADGAVKGRLLGRVGASLRHSAPLLALGLIRLYSVKGLEYAEHVTEYGVHWNFFFTLALLPPFVEVSESLTRAVFRSHDVLAVVLAVVYELVLNHTDLLRYILVSPRGPDLLSKNREGVFSCIGYLSIFLAGRGTGTHVVRYHEVSGSDPPRSSRPLPTPVELTRRERRVVWRRLLTAALTYAGLFWASSSVFVFNCTVSRRLANLPYVLWVVAFNNAQLLLFALVEGLGPEFSYSAGDAARVKDATSRVLRAFNANGLFLFLIANLSTGLVNLTVNTLDITAAGAMAVLLAHAAGVTAVALALEGSGVKLKI